MLEPVAYARDLLERAGEAAEADAAHAVFYLTLAEQAAPRYRRAEQLDWLARMDPETADTTLAVERSLDHADPVTAGRLCWALWLFWWLRGHLLPGRRLREAVLADERPPDDVRAPVLAAAGAMAFALGGNAAAGLHWRRAFDLGLAVGDCFVAAHTLPGVGIGRSPTGTSRRRRTRSPVRCRWPPTRERRRSGRPTSPTSGSAPCGCSVALPLRVVASIERGLWSRPAAAATG
jgi:hypothetical protein